MRTGFRFRCYPTPKQQQILLQWIGCQRFIYNSKVSEDRYFRSFAKKSLSLAGHYPPIDQKYSQFKTELTPWLKEVPSHILRNGAFLWKQAYSRFFQKLGGRPKIKPKAGKQSVYITNELFAFNTETNKQTGEVFCRLVIGNKKFLIGEVEYLAHRIHQIPKSIVISIDAGKWYISFSNEDNEIAIKEEDIAEELKQWSEDDLNKATIGIDRGAKIPVCSESLERSGFLSVQNKRIQKKEKHRKCWQRKMARRIKGSSGWKKAKDKVARSYQYSKNIRNDFAHKVSYELANLPSVRLIAFESLKIKSMTRRAKPIQDENGKYLPNRAKQKSGLNKKILASAWGKVSEYTKYKALKINKLVVEVPPHYSSQECSGCGYTHSDNRISQSDFVCQSCDLTINADINASKVIAKRGVDIILQGKFQTKVKKKIMRTKQQVGVVCSEPLSEMIATPSEIMVSRLLDKSNVAQVVDFGNPSLQA